MDMKQIYLPGDVVTIRQDIPHKPIMIVDKKVTKTVRIGGNVRNDFFQGIKCW